MMFPSKDDKLFKADAPHFLMSALWVGISRCNCFWYIYSMKISALFSDQPVVDGRQAGIFSHSVAFSFSSVF